MPIKININQGNIFLFLVQRMRPALTTKTKIIILTKQIVILCCILKQRAASYMQKQNTLLELTQIDDKILISPYGSNDLPHSSVRQ